MNCLNVLSVVTSWYPPAMVPFRLLSQEDIGDALGSAFFSRRRSLLAAYQRQARLPILRNCGVRYFGAHGSCRRQPAAQQIRHHILQFLPLPKREKLHLLDQAVREIERRFHEAILLVSQRSVKPPRPPARALCPPVLPCSVELFREKKGHILLAIPCRSAHTIRQRCPIDSQSPADGGDQWPGSFRAEWRPGSANHKSPSRSPGVRTPSTAARKTSAVQRQRLAAHAAPAARRRYRLRPNLPGLSLRPRRPHALHQHERRRRHPVGQLRPHRQRLLHAGAVGHWAVRRLGFLRVRLERQQPLLPYRPGQRARRRL